MPREEYFLKDGTQVDGITTILSNLGWSKDGLMYWAWGLGKKGINIRDAKEKECEAGSIAHYLIECYIKNIKPQIDRAFPNAQEETLKKAEAGFLNAREWMGLVNFRPFLTEVKFVSEKFKYGTKIDCLGFIGDGLGVMDWKTASDAYPDHKIQLAASGQLWLENNPDKPLDGGYHLLLFSKDSAAFTHKFWHDLGIAWEAFVDLISLNNKRKAIKRL